jgi:hypothetical protein
MFLILRVYSNLLVFGIKKNKMLVILIHILKTFHIFSKNSHLHEYVQVNFRLSCDIILNYRKIIYEWANFKLYPQTFYL